MSENNPNWDCGGRAQRNELAFVQDVEVEFVNKRVQALI